MYALQESVRQIRGTAPAQIPGARISVCHGVGGMFGASRTIIMSSEPSWGRHVSVGNELIERRRLLRKNCPRWQ